ncbi:hypothetical protein BDZ91DRAFT_760898 [Kalaharituber pfeilii]|nr:hypothetical protein BDZ91DRAFT_760898 [Kalaharituber pfeilii]
MFAKPKLQRLEFLEEELNHEGRMALPYMSLQRSIKTISEPCRALQSNEPLSATTSRSLFSSHSPVGLQLSSWLEQEHSETHRASAVQAHKISRLPCEVPEQMDIWLRKAHGMAEGTKVGINTLSSAVVVLKDACPDGRPILTLFPPALPPPDRVASSSCARTRARSAVLFLPTLPDFPTPQYFRGQTLTPPPPPSTPSTICPSPLPTPQSLACIKQRAPAPEEGDGEVELEELAFNTPFAASI